MALALVVALGVFLVSAVLWGQPADIVPADNLVVEGIPKIPAELVEQAGRYSEFREAAFMSWHPARREMLVGFLAEPALLNWFDDM